MSSSVPNEAPIIITAGGAVPIPTNPGFQLYNITGSPPAGILALTLAAPAFDGIILMFVDEVGFAHSIVCTGAGSPATAGLNSGTTNNKLLFNGARGTTCQLESRNGFWWATAQNGITIS